MNWKPFIREQGLALSWAISLAATLGSLYFSEVKGYIPCNLCWYQRILMYPLVLLLGIAAAKRDFNITRYALPMSLLGACFSLYHVLLENIEALKPKGASCGIVPCDVKYINWFGFITIPTLALTAFVLISIIHILIIRARK
ncbi:disulfide oxidoreductase [Paenibacillus sp. y28]|uniref:disulfide oxidoreductase n=1 Tax=Paenibacillus sp. y28 TaxID=3129110 RepID=UPI003018EDDD